MIDYFVGFGKASDWARAISQTPVNVECVTKYDGSDKMGLRSATQFLVMSQHKGDEVLYFMAVVDRFLAAPNLEPMDGADKHEQRRNSAYEAAERWLNDKMIPFRRAMIAQPKTLTLLEGDPDFMHYDAEQDKWVTP